MTHLARLLERLWSKPCKMTIQETSSVKKPRGVGAVLLLGGQSRKNVTLLASHKLDIDRKIYLSHFCQIFSEFISNGEAALQQEPEPRTDVTPYHKKPPPHRNSSPPPPPPLRIVPLSFLSGVSTEEKKGRGPISLIFHSFFPVA
jgi:hypothetical protein